MQVLLLLLALLHLTDASTSAPVVLASCTDPNLRAQVNTAVQETLARVGLPKMETASTVLEKLRDAQTLRSLALLHQFQDVAKITAANAKACEVDIPNEEEPMFITVLYINPHTGNPGGAVYNFGLGPLVAQFGDKTGL